MKKHALAALAAFLGISVLLNAYFLFSSGRPEEPPAPRPAAVPRAVAVGEESAPAPDPAPAQTESSSADAGQAAAASDEPDVFTVDGFWYDGDREITLRLSCEPDMDVVREYVTAGPLEKGRLSFSVRHLYDWETRLTQPALKISGDFARRTNLTLRVRAGFPPKGGAAAPLASDYSRGFRRKDADPSVGFFDTGRYLPPMGARALALKSINTPKIRAQVRKVPPANIVQLLALEEGAYDDIHAAKWNGEEGYVRDISSDPVETMIPSPNRLNKEEKTYLSLGPTNGIYLVTLTRGDKEPGDSPWGENPQRHRVVCMSDLGISVRQTPKGILVWTTSLSSGLPVAGAEVDVYSSANILLASGLSDDSGLVSFGDIKGKPFAVTVSLPDGSDRSFMALRGSMAVGEDIQGMEGRGEYLKDNESAAFLWTDRGIYRHGERIFFHAILRNGLGAAPKPFPLELCLVNPSGMILSKKTVFPDASGALSHEGFSVPDSQPSGNWQIRLKTPGAKGVELGARKITVEEFAPPQIRVKTVPSEDAKPSGFSFAVTAEHLYGGPAGGLSCDGAVVFEDVPFAPEGWKGYFFGSEDRGLKPSFRELGRDTLDAGGRFVFDAPLAKDGGKPKAAVKVTCQASVFEDGGRPATARSSAVLHAYPHYIGLDLPSWLRKPESGRPVVNLACVTPDGKRLAAERKLVLKLERIESIYSYRLDDDGWATWDCERVRHAVAEDFAFSSSADRDTLVEIPADECGDYVLTVEDPEADVQFAKTFYLSDWGDASVRAPLANPTAVTVACDKPFYRPGDEPRLVVKSPFPGTALVTVLRDSLVHAEVVALTNATGEIVLPACAAEWAPNVDVYVSVLQGVAAGSGGLAARAHGAVTLAVRPEEREIPVSVEAETKDGVAEVCISAPGADRLAVTLVDEAINILTDEPVPDPLAFFASPRRRDCLHDGLYDLYCRILPVFGEDSLKANGVKTGGGCDAGMLGRVSPVASRRFKPLSLWRKDVPVVDGKAKVSFPIPEFLGELRVTAVAYSGKATGSASLLKKVCPKLVIEPDAPRFVAPGDEFRVTLPVSNMSGEADEIAYRVSDGRTSLASGTVRLEAGGSTVLKLKIKAPEEPGHMTLVYTAMGCGERHEKTIELPVRPAMPWKATAGVEFIEAGASFTLPAEPSESGVKRLAWKASGSPAAELDKAYRWLAAYPHGCLEQTASQIFPLLYVDGKTEYVEAGVARVSSMIRQNDFTMWPDCNYEPWDPEVSLYAAHFLVEAERRGTKLAPKAKESVMKFLGKWAMSTNTAVSAYACHTLALAGVPERDRMLRLYDDMGSLSLLSRARLARAFVASADLKRAAALLANAESPSTVKEAAFGLLALIETDPGDRRIPALVLFLQSRRNKALFAWGTTEENAHALLALGAWYRMHPAEEGEPEIEANGRVLKNVGKVPAYVTWEMLELPSVAEDADESTALSIKREYFTSSGEPYDLAKASLGDLVVVRLTLEANEDRWLNDLVVEDLFPGAFEPVLNWEGFAARKLAKGDGDWVMRYDARDDRMLVFSKRFQTVAGACMSFEYPVRIVSPGEYALPGASVEAMYTPSLRARVKGSTIKIAE
ncbi:MAG: hypothetical protein K6F50_06070 [Kiritimatiellae bacterium]|nr:hypothetical protein [Kiritimatiellia bacterium]